MTKNVDLKVMVVANAPKHNLGTVGAALMKAAK